MARHSFPPEVYEVGGWALKLGAAYVGLQMASTGAFGSGLQTFASQLLGTVSNVVTGVEKGLPVPIGTTTTAGGGSNAAGTGTPAGAPPSGFSHQGGTTSPMLTAMIAANPNFVAQATQWRQIRAGIAPGYGSSYWGDPNDWSAFESYQKGIGAPDPGSLPCPEWPTYFGGPLSTPTSLGT